MTLAAEPRHFLDLDRIEPNDLRKILDAAAARKAARENSAHGAPDTDRPLSGRMLAMLFEKPSTRTRVSFDVGMRQLGGETLVLNSGDMQLGRGETISDTARVMSRYVDALMLRANSHAALLDLAEASDIPIINGLTNKSHPCQIMADILTFEEHRGSITGRDVAWLGDGNNVAASWIHAAVQFGFSLRLGCPPELSPAASLIAWAQDRGAEVSITHSAHAAAEGASCIVTDTWVSMGDTNADERKSLLAPYQVNSDLMKRAAKEAVFMHCLPAHRNEEVTDDVIDGPQSVVFDEAENRLHAQKAILLWCLGV